MMDDSISAAAVNDALSNAVAKFVAFDANTIGAVERPVALEEA